jgi:hypothetical protein
MPPYTKLPRPEGHVRFSYHPMSPPNWGIVPANLHTFVYRDVNLAMQAMLQAITTIHAQRLEDGTASLFSDYVYYRGQTDLTQRLLPTRLRGPRQTPPPRQRYPVKGEGPPDQDPRNHWGDWLEDVEPWRVIEDSVAELSEEELHQRDVREKADIERATKLAEIFPLDSFLRRAAVRHYSGAPSPLLDVSTNPEVAAFFATGGGSTPPPAGQIGMLWAIDLNFLAGLFAIEITPIPLGVKIRLREERDKWGDNSKFFKDYGILPVCLELTAVALPFARPVAQYARFFSLTGEDGSPLPLLTELAWWSIIERHACTCAFLHNGRTYENPGHNITKAALLPGNEPLAAALG